MRGEQWEGEEERGRYAGKLQLSFVRTGKPDIEYSQRPPRQGMQHFEGWEPKCHQVPNLAIEHIAVEDRCEHFGSGSLLRWSILLMRSLRATLSTMLLTHLCLAAVVKIFVTCDILASKYQENGSVIRTLLAKIMSIQVSCGSKCFIFLFQQVIAYCKSLRHIETFIVQTNHRFVLHLID